MKQLLFFFLFFTFPAFAQDNLYRCTFNDGTDYAPFRDGWAWSPSYIKVVDDCLEFYYNQEACDRDNRRMRRGCEVVCDFSTTSEAWYGYRIFLPEGKFPKDLHGSIITQIFNSGRRNSWAGHLSIEEQNLVVSYRNALVEPRTAVVGRLEWGKWQDVILYFRAGRNGKGAIRVWLGSDLHEDHPTLSLDGINLGFAEQRIDDTHFDPTPYEANGKIHRDAFGGKWGMYVSQGGDRTLRLDNLAVLEGNPKGAFDLVNPRPSTRVLYIGDSITDGKLSLLVGSGDYKFVINKD